MKFSTIVTNIIGVLKGVLPLIVGATVLIFLYGLLGYMMNVGDEAKRKESLSYITYGLIGLFVMISFWGLVAVFSSTFGLDFGIPRIL